MFQYALCLALQKKGKRASISFVRYLYDYHHNGFDLWKAFRLPLPMPQRLLASLVTGTERLYRHRLGEQAFRILIPRLELRGSPVYREKEEFVHDPEVLCQDESFIMGTWQAEEYFREYGDEVSRAFTFRIPRDASLAELVDRTQSTHSVSLHIRRGDYFGSTYGTTHSVLGSLTYYHRALDYIRQRVPDPHVFVFSDDIPWARRHLPLDDATYVEGNKGGRSYLDMYLMSRCRHNIIANSTFSWWGGWLNPNREKIVVMPDVWLQGKECPGICPKGWVRMPAA